MRLLTLLAVFLLPLSALAEDSDTHPSIFSRSHDVRVLHPTPNIVFLFDQKGHTATIYEQGPGWAWYSEQDWFGHVTSQGYFFYPLPQPGSQQVPLSIEAPYDTLTGQYRR